MTFGLSENDVINTIVETIRKEDPQSVKHLVHLLREKLTLPEKQITNLILKLQEEGVIDLEQSPPQLSRNFASFLRTSNAYWYWIIIVLTSAAATIFFAIPENTYPWVYLRYILGTVFVLWLPGYALTKTLYMDVSGSGKNLDSIERLGLSIGSSLAITSIIGLLLNYTPWGIRLTPIVLSLSALTLILATTTIIREYQAHISSTG